MKDKKELGKRKGTLSGMEVQEKGLDRNGNPRYHTDDPKCELGKKCKKGGRDFSSYEKFSPVDEGKNVVKINESDVVRMVNESIKRILKEDEGDGQMKWYGIIMSVPTEIGYDKWGEPECKEFEYQLFPVYARNEKEAEEAQKEMGWPTYASDEDWGDENYGEVEKIVPLSDEDIESLGISIEDLYEGGSVPEAYSEECAAYSIPSDGSNSVEDILSDMGLGSSDYLRDQSTAKGQNVYGGYHLVRNKQGLVNLMDPENGETLLDEWMKAIRPIRQNNSRWSFVNRAKGPNGGTKYIAEGTTDGETYFLIEADGSIQELGDYKIEGLTDGNVILKSGNGYNVLGPDGKLRFDKDVAELSKYGYGDDRFRFRKDADGPIGIYDREGNGIIGADRGYKHFRGSGIKGTILAETDKGYEILDEKTGENVFGTYFDEEPETVSMFSTRQRTGYSWNYDSDGDAEKEYDYSGGNDAVTLHSPEKGYALSSTYYPGIITGQWSEEPIKSVNLKTDNRAIDNDAVLIYTISGKEYAYYNNKFIPKERVQNYLDNREEFDLSAKNRDEFNKLDRIRKQYPDADYNEQEKYFDPDQAVYKWNQDPYKFAEPKFRTKTFKDKDDKVNNNEYGDSRRGYDLSDKAYNAARDKMNASKYPKPWYDTEVPGEEKYPNNEGRSNRGNKLRLTESDVRNMVYNAVKKLSK